MQLFRSVSIQAAESNWILKVRLPFGEKFHMFESETHSH